MERKPPHRDLRSYRHRTERNLFLGFVLILLLVGGGLILWRYGWGGWIGGMACLLTLLGLAGLLWLLLTWAGRWAERDDA